MSPPWSCDSFVALPNVTASRSTLFGKNSDRPAGEAQPLRSMPSRSGSGTLPLVYLEIPDAPSYAHVGGGPFWCWGYEHGVNEKRVAIGNEAVFTRPLAAARRREERAQGPTPGILGMELVRLGLERGETAAAALDVIAALVERFGQWGSAKHGDSHLAGSYDNSFIIADPQEAWILETYGTEWAARCVTSGTYSISNELSIRSQFDVASTGLIPMMRRNRWWLDERVAPDLASVLTDPGTPLQVSHIRRQRSMAMLRDAAETHRVSMSTAQAILRDHLEGTFLDGPTFEASRPDFLTICMHEHESGFTWGNTASSLIVELAADPDVPTPLWWCPVTPCTGVYIPIFVNSSLPAGSDLPVRAGPFEPRAHRRARFDPESMWWQWQQLLDIVKDPVDSSFAERSRVVRARFDPLEREWSAGVPATDDPAELSRFSAACAAEAVATVRELIREFGGDLDAPRDLRWGEQ